MEFWGVEVKAGKPLEVSLEEGKLIHISQAALGEGKKEKDIVPLRVKINEKKYVVGSLSAENFPQITFDLVFEKDFELSHDWKNGSVYFCGYIADNPSGEEVSDDSDSEDEVFPSGITENGNVQPKLEEVKPEASKGKEAKPRSSAKHKVTVVEPKKDESFDDDDSDDESDSDDEGMPDASDDISGSDSEDDSDEEDDDSDDSDEETPKKAVLNKKRPNESASKTPVPVKKGKTDSAQKTDGKKGGGHVATPYPSKQGGKTPAGNKQQTPKSGGSVPCKSCDKSFKSDIALQSHSKAKHAAK